MWGLNPNNSASAGECAKGLFKDDDRIPLSGIADSLLDLSLQRIAVKIYTPGFPEVFQHRVSDVMRPREWSSGYGREFLLFAEFSDKSVSEWAAVNSRLVSIAHE